MLAKMNYLNSKMKFNYSYSYKISDVFILDIDILDIARISIQ